MYVLSGENVFVGRKNLRSQYAKTLHMQVQFLLWLASQPQKPQIYYLQYGKIIIAIHNIYICT